MNNVYSDLEEGEILDDSPSSPSDSVEIVRELPRRYLIQKNRETRIHKHRKKDCKNAIRYHAKKLTKLKKSPEKLKDINKKHHKSTCPHDKSSKLSNKSGLVVQKHILTKNGHSFPKQSLIAAMKDSLKDHSIDIQNVKLKPKKDQNLSKLENKNINDDKLLNRKDIQTNARDLDDSKQYSQQSVQYSEDLPTSIEVKPDNVKLSNVLPSNSPDVKSEESEDEEELRKIALATFCKRKPDTELSKKLIKSEDHSKSLEINESFSLPEINNIESDNYEVVDMDVDEDTETAIEVFEKPLEGQLSERNEDLYVIDNKPFVEDHNRDTSSEFPSHNSSDEDFEADILRAELIQSMYREKCLLEDEVPEQKPQPIVPSKNCISNYQKTNNKFYHKHLKPKHIVRKILTKKSEKLSYNACKSVALNNQLQIKKKSPERLIISLNEESSSEESESQEENLAPGKSVVPENPVASIEALISDCRQKSESTEKNQEVVQPVSRAVSCLSKAQQEEYQSLMKILAAKEKLPAPAKTVQNKNDSTNSPLNDLKLTMEKKLLKLKEDFKKKDEYLKLLPKEINSKKLLYMKSKLSAQLLKERYLRAEKIRKTNFSVWSKSCIHYKNVEKTVSSLANKIDQFEKLYLKLSAGIQERTCNSPSLATNNSNFTI